MIGKQEIISTLVAASLIPLLAFCQKAEQESNSAALLSVVGLSDPAGSDSSMKDNGVFRELVFPTREICKVSSLDAQEGGGMDIQKVCLNYTASSVTIDLYFYSAVTLGWGDPYIYFYDIYDGEANDLLIFDSGRHFHIVRDRDNNGHFETEVFSGTSITTYDFGKHYRVTVPRGVLPDISSRDVWVYAMSSQDRAPNTGAMHLTAGLSTNTLDPAEGGIDDYRKLKAGYDSTVSYIELELHLPVAALGWGEPYVRLYDPAIGSPDHYMVFWTGSEVTLKQDTNGDGYFETILYSGQTLTQLEGGSRYTFLIPAGLINNMQNKNIWSYSMQSLDRVPDGYNDYMTFP